MKILVTGGTGSFGDTVLKHFIKLSNIFLSCINEY